MELGLLKIGMTFADDDQCMWVVEVEEHHNDLVDQMCEQKIVVGKKKSQHVDVEVDAWYVVACHTVRKKISEVKKHNEKKRYVNLHHPRVHLVEVKGTG